MNSQVKKKKKKSSESKKKKKEFPSPLTAYSPVKFFASSIATAKSTIWFSVRKDNSGTEKNLEKIFIKHLSCKF